MPNKNFILLSMEDDKIKKISNVISNDSCRKILDYLSTHEATESELAEKLQLPISTVHYNLQQLMGTGLVSADEYHYSQKGKEVLHYKLANKYIIIAPKKTSGIREKLKGILPVVLIVSGAAFVIQFISKYSGRTVEAAEPMMMAKIAEDASVESMAAPAPLAETATSLWSNIALWFFAGAMFALLIYVLVSLIRKKGD